MPSVASRTADRVRSTNWVEIAGRAGHLTKGIVYAVIGFLAASAAMQGGRAAGSDEAIAVLGQQAFGQVLLWLTAGGLLGYSVWRAIEAVKAPGLEREGYKVVLARAGGAASAVAHALLAWTAGSMAWYGHRTAGGEGRRDAAAQVLALPGGRLILAAVGFILLGVGIHQLYLAYTTRFMQKYKLSEMNDTEKKTALVGGRIGLSARGVTFGIIALSVITAAFNFDPEGVEGIGEALQTLALQPYGPWLLGAIAIGLVGYAAHCVMEAQYRRFDVR